MKVLHPSATIVLDPAIGSGSDRRHPRGSGALTLAGGSGLVVGGSGSSSSGALGNSGSGVGLAQRGSKKGPRHSGRSLTSSGGEGNGSGVPRQQRQHGDRVHPNPEESAGSGSGFQQKQKQSERHSPRVGRTTKGLSRRGTGAAVNNTRTHSASATIRTSLRAVPDPDMVNGSKANGGGAGDSSPRGVSFRRLRRSHNNNNNNHAPSTPDVTIDANAVNAEYEERHNNNSNRRSKKLGSAASTPRTDASTPASSPYNGSSGRAAKTPAGVRGRSDLRSPGVKKSPIAASSGAVTTANIHDQAAIAAAAAAAQQQQGETVPIPDFITQTDKYGNACTPRSADAIAGARRQHPTGPEPHIHVTSDGKAIDDEGHELHPHEIEHHHAADKEQDHGIDVDPCDALLESLRSMCCCLLPEDSSANAAANRSTAGSKKVHSALSKSGGATTARSQYSTRESTEQIMYEDAAGENQVKLLPAHHPEDLGKKCLVLDLDETLVHSSFRAVPGADFVIPVQIEDVVHFVYVMKRPGVDEFLIEMAKHYEIVIYTASLNKYADPLLDLLDPHRTIRTRLFRESCVYYEGNYVKDLSLLDRDLSQSIIIDNSPSSYIFHPENAIDCTSFIDDPNDRELDQIGAFLKGIRNIEDVRGVSNLWRDWPSLTVEVEGLVFDEE